MASLTSAQVEKGLIDQIVSEFFAKSLQVILDSRIPYISMQTHLDDSPHRSAASTSTSSPSSRPNNRWFNLEMDNCAAVEESVEPWRRGSMEPMVVDILLQQPMGGEIPSPSGGAGARGYFKGNSPSRGNSSGESWSGEVEGCVSPGGLSRTILERWVIQYVPRKKSGLAGGFGAGKVGAGGFGDGSAGVSGKPIVKGIGGGGPPLPYPLSHVVERPVVYKRTVIMLRSLYCTTRTLPAHRLFRLVNSSSHSRSFTLSYRVSPASSPLSEADETAMMTCNLTPVETMWGRICVSVAYRHTTAVTALEITPPILPRIISDYVGSPTTDPLRRFSNVGSMPGGISGRIGVHVISLPSSVPSSPSGPNFGRRHSWSGDRLQKLPPALTATPSFRVSRSPSPGSHPSPPMPPSPYPSSPSPNIHFNNSPRTSPSRPSFPRPSTSQPSSYHQVGSGNSSQPIPIRDQGRSPTFSPSPTPSPPTPSHQYHPEGGGGLARHRSAPVSIPRPASAPRASLGTSPRPLLTEGPAQQQQARIQYPPPSPSRNVDNLPRALSANKEVWTGPLWTSPMPNIFIPGLDGRATARLSISTLAESSLLVSPPHPFYPHQGAEETGGEGPPSGVKRSLYASPPLITLGSRSIKTVSDIDGDEEFSCPFAVDDDEAEEYRSRMESPRVKNISDPFEQVHPKSQDAAVGALVRILKSAPPLRHGLATLATSGSPSPRMIMPVGGHPGSMGGGRVKNSPPRPNATKARSGSTFLVGSPGSQLVVAGKVSQKTSGFALEELKSYIEMRDHLLRQSGG